MKKNYHILLLSFLLLNVLYFAACKKDELNAHDFTAKHLQGTWWLAERVVIIEKDGQEVSRDTSRFRPADLPDSIVRDTLKFFEDRTYSRRDSIRKTFSIDAEAENIDFADTLGVWNITSLKMRDILLKQSKPSTGTNTTERKTVLELFSRK